jgi:hypothetical protein
MRREKNKNCPLPQISAYVDGELSKQDELILETHIANCPICFQELNEQKKLLCVLDFALSEDLMDFPEMNRSIVVRAESNVVGLKNNLHKLILTVLLLVCFYYRQTDSVLNPFVALLSFLHVIYESLNNFLLGLSTILKFFIFKDLLNAIFFLGFCLILISIFALVKKSLDLNK